MNAPAATVLELREVSCARAGLALRSVSLSFPAGSLSILAGDSASGHQLLLRLLGLHDTPEQGAVLLEGAPTAGLDETTRQHLRERRLGFLFAAPFLLPTFSLIENVAMPLFKISEVELSVARARSEELLEFVGLKDKAQERSGALSPLEQHCASLARALANGPAALLVESVDSGLTGPDLAAFLERLAESCARFHVAVIATASPALARAPDAARHFSFADGALLASPAAPSANPA